MGLFFKTSRFACDGGWKVCTIFFLFFAFSDKFRHFFFYLFNKPLRRLGDSVCIIFWETPRQSGPGRIGVDEVSLRL